MRYRPHTKCITKQKRYVWYLHWQDQFKDEYRQLLLTTIKAKLLTIHQTMWFIIVVAIVTNDKKLYR